MNQMSVEMGDSPVQNWRGSNRDFAPRRSASVDPDRIIAHQKTRYHCRACPLGCGGLANYDGQTVHKPEYETVNAFGGLLLNQDMESIWAINERLNRAGMDTISAGATIAFAIECFENGVITRQDTGGLELAWRSAGRWQPPGCRTPGPWFRAVRRPCRRAGAGDARWPQ
jgi:aldehyde:ferredoxin oxidoreductase